MVPHARRVGGKTCVLDPLWVAENLSKPTKLAVIAYRKRKKAIRAGKDILRLDVGMPVAAALWRVAQRLREATGFRKQKYRCGAGNFGRKIGRNSRCRALRLVAARSLLRTSALLA